MIGNVIGNYKILAKIGEGGMGAVYKGVDMMLEREVAIKALRPELARQPQIVERFRAEAVTLAKLYHPNIATLHSFFRQGDEYFMVMEFVRGQTLDSVLRTSGGMAVTRALPLFCQALEGIDHAHKMGIIHRDIKPANMMFTETGSIKVMDFGIARVLGTARMTKQGNIIGTVEYMSPEQVRGHEADARSDIYSLGILLYEMLTGRVPFSNQSEYELMRSQIEDAPVPPTDFAPQVPVTVEEAIMRALAKKPEARFQSAADFNRSLLAAIGSTAPLSSGTGPRPAVSPGTLEGFPVPPGALTGPTSTPMQSGWASTGGHIQSIPEGSGESASFGSGDLPKPTRMPSGEVPKETRIGGSGEMQQAISGGQALGTYAVYPQQAGPQSGATPPVSGGLKLKHLVIGGAVGLMLLVVMGLAAVAVRILRKPVPAASAVAPASTPLPLQAVPSGASQPAPLQTSATDTGASASGLPIDQSPGQSDSSSRSRHGEKAPAATGTTVTQAPPAGPTIAPISPAPETKSPAQTRPKETHVQAPTEAKGSGSKSPGKQTAAANDNSQKKPGKIGGLFKKIGGLIKGDKKDNKN